MRKVNNGTTLALDIGGTGIKVMLLGAGNRALSDRHRMDTPQPATPAAMLDVIGQLTAQVPGYKRVSAGFPGVIRNGVIETAHNLDPSWVGQDLGKLLGDLLKVPVLTANDADMQGLGVVKGKGVELFLTLGTGLGSALFVEGQLVPNLELAHHEFRKGKTYEEMLGKNGLKKAGSKRWNRHLEKAVEQLRAAFNYDWLFVGGGNADKVRPGLSCCTTLTTNEEGLHGAAALWKQR